MKKFLMLIAAIAVMAAPVFAQSAFQDVPADHWAYDAVDQLQKQGLMEGYPDGEFKGKRSMTRYEFAESIAKIIGILNSDGVDFNVKDFATKGDLSGYALKSDIPGAADLSGLASKADLDTLAKLANEFKAELASLGVDINAINADLNALRSRVAAIEDEQARVKITGTATFAGAYASSKDSDNVINIDGRESFGGKNSQSIEFVKDFQVNIKGRVNNNINAYLSLVASDYNTKTYGVDDDAKNMEVIPWYAYATADMGKYGNYTLGRMPMQLNKYVYKRYDDNSYIDIARMDDGNFATDGVDYKVAFGSVDVRAWLVQPANTMFNGDYDPVYKGSNFGWDNATPKFMSGAEIGVNIKSARVAALFDFVRNNKTDVKENKEKNVKVYGATLAIPFGSFALDAAYFQQKGDALRVAWVGEGKPEVKDKANLIDVNLGFNYGKLNASAGYLDVEAGYETPSDYEAMAYIHNPNNVRGFKLGADYDFGPLTVYGAFKSYKVKNEDYKTDITKWKDYFDKDDNKINYIKGGVKFGIGNIGKFDVKYENIKTFGVKSNYMTASWMKKVGNANFKLAYQYVVNKDVEKDEKDVKKDNKGSILYGQASYSF